MNAIDIANAAASATNAAVVAKSGNHVHTYEYISKHHYTKRM
jgi:hypothetical protein